MTTKQYQVAQRAIAALNSIALDEPTRNWLAIHNPKALQQIECVRLDAQKAGLSGDNRAGFQKGK